MVKQYITIAFITMTACNFTNIFTSQDESRITNPLNQSNDYTIMMNQLKNLAEHNSNPLSSIWQDQEFPTPASRYFNGDSSFHQPSSFAHALPWNQPCDKAARFTFKEDQNRKALLQLISDTQEMKSDIANIKLDVAQIKTEMTTYYSDIKASLAMILYSVARTESKIAPEEPRNQK